MSVDSEQGHGPRVVRDDEIPRPPIVRGHRACVECRRKKTRCDMKQPTCGLCERTSSSCTFPTKRKPPEQRKGVGKDGRKSQKEVFDRLLTLLENRFDSHQSVDDILAAHLSYNSIGAGNISDRRSGISPSSMSGLQQSPRQMGSQAWDTHSQVDATSPVTARNTEISAEQEGFLPSVTIPLDTPEDMAEDLVNLFFHKIQTWLPLLHQPRFNARYMNGPFESIRSTVGFSVEEALLFNGMFALAARYSKDPRLAHTPAPQRGDNFARKAKELSDQVQTQGQRPTLLYLQGCILLAFYYYSCGPRHEGWVLTGHCVRLAYALDLSNVDETVDENLDAGAWVGKEELRRAWWLVWELDAFGSTVSRRPYAINRRRMSVLLPVSDEAWFTSTPVQSAMLRTGISEVWKSLQGSPNQDVRSWFLVANFIMALGCDLMNTRGTSEEEIRGLADTITCFALALPEEYRLDSETLSFDPENYPRSNWIINLHMMLVTARNVIDALDIWDGEGHAEFKLKAPMARGREISRIIFHWHPDYICVSHPFVACTFLPPHLFPFYRPTSEPPSGLRDMFRLVLRRYADVWKFGAALLELDNIISNSRDKLSPEQLALAKTYAVYFPTFIKSSTSPLSLNDPQNKVTAHSVDDVLSLDPSQTVVTSQRALGVVGGSVSVQSPTEFSLAIDSQVHGSIEASSLPSSEFEDIWSFTAEQITLDQAMSNLDYFAF